MIRSRLKLAAHQRAVSIDAAMRAASDLTRERGAAAAVAQHAPAAEIDQFVRNACAVAIADEHRPGIRIGAACAAGDAVNGHQGPAIFMR